MDNIPNLSIPCQQFLVEYFLSRRVGMDHPKACAEAARISGTNTYATSEEIEYFLAAADASDKSSAVTRRG